MTKAAEYYLLGLQYNDYMGNQVFGYQNAREQIVDRIKALSPFRRLAFAQAVEKLETEWHIDQSRLRDLLWQRALWAL